MDDSKRKFDTLSPKERAVAEAIHRGVNRKDIAHSMGITNGTLQNYLNHAYAKLGLEGGGSKQAQLVLIVERALHA